MIEFRVRVTDQAWKDIPAILRFDVEYLWRVPSTQNDVADDLAKELAVMTGAPVRWNWEGSLQGHYVEES